MSEFKPRPLASYAKTTRLSDMEANIVVATAMVGGSCYSGGSPVGPFPGALGKTNLKASPWITNDRKTEPYSYLVLRAGIPSLPSASARTVYVPVGMALQNAVPVSVTAQYGAGSATWNGNVNFRICDSSLITIDCSVTPLTAGQYLTQTSASATWTTNPDPTQNYIVMGVSGTTGLTTTGWLMTAIFKTKHIA